ncbi:MAG TPA: RecQ family ATP-dependent DNA helicase, partial [Saprospiraceae bacterium]|nr:RecQ family ATP-dependent DNA helicase [Saprospiraceae bacterium]
MNISDTLKKFYGYDDFRPLQEEIIETIITGNDAFVLMPTGGGKSICYQIPALHRKGIAIIISPLIALMKDQVMALRQNGIPSAFINSSLHHSEINNIVSQCIEGKIKLLYLSPETLIVQKENLLNQLVISLFAIDEAHCISAWGHDFRKEYTQLGFLKIKYPHIPIIALTATADKVTRNDILKQLNIENAKQFIASFDRPNLHLKVVKAAPEQAKIDKIIELYHKYPNSSGIIYCLSRKSTEKIALKLQEKGISCKAYHAGLDSF